MRAAALIMFAAASVLHVASVWARSHDIGSTLLITAMLCAVWGGAAAFNGWGE